MSSISGIVPFQKEVQNLCVKDQNVRNKFRVVDDDKHDLNYKTPTDNLQLLCHVCDNRIGLVNYTAVLAGCNLVLRTEYEKHEDNTTSTLKRLIKKNIFTIKQ